MSIPLEIPPRRYLIAVGSPSCPGMDLHDLSRVESDINRVVALFTNEQQGYEQVLVDQIPLKAKARVILDELGSWLSSPELKNEDCVLVYYAGHGAKAGNSGQHYLFTVDSNSHNLSRTAIKTSSLVELFVEAGPNRPKNILLLLDTCYSGQGAGQATALVSQHKEVVRGGSGLWIITSADLRTEASDGGFVDALEKAMGDRTWMSQDKEFLNPLDLKDAINLWLQTDGQTHRAEGDVTGNQKQAVFIRNPYFKCIDRLGFMPLMPERLPNDLNKPSIFEGREEELRALCSLIKPNTKIWLHGQQGIGKKALIAQLLNTRIDDIRSKFTKSLALLRLKFELKTSNTLFDACVNAFGRDAFLKFIPNNSIEEQNEQELDEIEIQSKQELRNSSFYSCLESYYLHKYIPFVIIEDSHGIINENQSVRADLSKFLSGPVFRQSCIIFVTCEEPRLDSHNYWLEFEPFLLSPLSEAHNRALLITHLGLSATEIVDECLEIIDRKIRLTPAVIGKASKRFNYKMKQEKITHNKLAEELYNAILETYNDEGSLIRNFFERIYVDVQSLVSTAENIGEFGTILVLSLLPELSFTPKEIVQANLSLSSIETLLQLEVIIESATGQYYLSQPAIIELRKYWRNKILSDSYAQEILTRFLVYINKLLEVLALNEQLQNINKIRTSCQVTIEWLKECNQAVANTIIDPLYAFIITESVDDYFFPLPDGQLNDYQRRRQQVPQQNTINDLIALTIYAARFEKNRSYEESKFRFIESLKNAVQYLVTPSFLTATGRQLLALDQAAFIGTSSFHCNQEVFEIRLSLRQPLIETLHIVSNVPPRFLKAAAGWLLNSAWLAINLGKIECARSFWEDARRFAERLSRYEAPYEFVNNLWIESWMRQIQARLEMNPKKRLLVLKEAQNYSAEILKSNQSARWLQSYLRATRRVLTEIPGDEEREKAIDDLLDDLEKQYGAANTWGIEVCAQVAALLRDISTQFYEFNNFRLRISQQSVELLRYQKENLLWTVQGGDLRPSLVLIRCLANLAGQYKILDRHGNKAQQCVREAYELAKQLCNLKPTVHLWRLVLNLAGDVDRLVIKDSWKEYSDFDRLSMTSSLFNQEQKAYKRWRITHKVVSRATRSEGYLELELLTRQWSEQGSLERYASHHGQYREEWARLTEERGKKENQRKHFLNRVNRQIEILKQIHYERISKLKDLEKKFGRSLPIHLNLAQRWAQYERSVAMRRQGNYDGQSVLDVFNDAERWWTDSYVLLEERAYYERYVWNFEEAIVRLRKLLRSSSNGEQRRRASIRLAECLLFVASYYPRFKINGEYIEARQLAIEAGSLLDNLDRYTALSTKISTLKDRIALEVSEPINWTAMEETYENIIRGIGGYITGVLEFYDSRKNDSSAHNTLPRETVDLIKKDPTDFEYLHNFGFLFLRRAEKNCDTDSGAARDSERAYAIFDGCRQMQEAWYDGRELSTNRYARARSIFIAAKSCKSINPFSVKPQLYRGRKVEDWLDLAVRLLDGSRYQAVGLFREVVERSHKEAVSLRNNLNPPSAP